jgi:hypothetical protein
VLVVAGVAGVAVVAVVAAAVVVVVAVVPREHSWLQQPPVAWPARERAPRSRPCHALHSMTTLHTMHIAPAAHHQVLGSEAALVEDITTPGGLRPLPDAADLRRFVDTASALDGLALAEQLRDKMVRVRVRVRVCVCVCVARAVTGLLQAS